MIKDAQGHTLSGVTKGAVALYDDAVRAFNVGYGDVAGLLDAARNAAPGFVMARLGRAWLLAFARDPALTPHAGLLLETTANLAMNEREQGHLAALRQAVTGALGPSNRVQP